MALTRPVSANGFGWSPPAVTAAHDGLLKRWELLPETPALFDAWRRLVSARGISGKRARDARLVAWMRVHDVRRVMTFNAGDFAGFDDVDVWVPGAPARA